MPTKTIPGRPYPTGRAYDKVIIVAVTILIIVYAVDSLN